VVCGLPSIARCAVPTKKLKRATRHVCMKTSSPLSYDHCVEQRTGTRTVHVNEQYSLDDGDLPLLELIHRESKKGVTLTMAITLSILDRLAKLFHCC